jgi:hypothetical protein
MKPKARAVKSTGNIQGVVITVHRLHSLKFFLFGLMLTSIASSNLEPTYLLKW